MKKQFIPIIFVLTAALLLPTTLSAKKKSKIAAVPNAAEKPDKIPVVEEIPEPIIAALAKGDLKGALIIMHDEKPSLKLKQLINDATRAATFDTSKKPDKSEAHKAYQNVGVSYHNLYLFLKRHNIEQKDYFKRAIKYYSKARSAATILHKSECDLLMAALYASAGDQKKAQKLFDKIDVSMMRGDLESMEYLAAYHAASGNIEEALNALEAAHNLNPDLITGWLLIGDDFAGIESDPRYTGLVDSWRKSQKDQNELTLSVPKSKEPSLEMTTPEVQFAPQKMMKHATKKEVAELKKKKRSSRQAATHSHLHKKTKSKTKK